MGLRVRSCGMLGWSVPWQTVCSAYLGRQAWCATIDMTDVTIDDEQRRSASFVQGTGQPRLTLSVLS